MATNVEIKAKVSDLESLRRKVQAISQTPGKLMAQEDVFFHTEEGRLKLRVLGSNNGQLIYYERENRTGPRRSEYLIAETAAPDRLKQVLAKALGVRGVVRKQRQLYWVGNTRIHLDRVEGLGTFMELEVVLSEGESLEAGEAQAAELMTELEVTPRDLIKQAYIDLLEQMARQDGPDKGGQR